MTGLDGSTGLTLTADSQLVLHFFRCPIDDTLTAALSDEIGTTPLSLHFPEVPWVSPTTRNLILRARAEPTTAPGIWSRGAGAWLDEGLHDSLQLQTETLYLLSVIDESRSIHVSASAAGCSIETSFRPTFIDLDGSLLRIADRHGRHAVHLHPGRVRAHQDHDQLRLHSIPA
ncbi:hypothetical protein [Haloferula sargassicola]|uniref:Uncharacterized protein n=1 Tax=Haloferula sargassicola TaxID=490096 RepID=A0ABP9UL01_9BACT